jgi:hypothetical protein
MRDSRDRLRTELLTDLEEKSRQGVLDGVDESLVDTVLEEHSPGADIDSLIGRFGMTYLVAELVLSYFERQSLAVTHRSQWPPRDIAHATGTDVSTDLLEELSDTVDGNEPETYDDIVEMYLELAGDSLNPVACRTLGDRTTSSDVQLEITAGDRQQETTLRAGGREIDVESVLDPLNRVLETTTEDNRRLRRVAFDPQRVHVFFLTPDDRETMADYFAFARACGQEHVNERGGSS